MEKYIENENKYNQTGLLTGRILDYLALKSQGESFDTARSEALFNFCFSALLIDPDNNSDALRAFFQLVCSNKVQPEVKSEALTTLATMANGTSTKLQEDSLNMIERLNQFITEGDIDLFQQPGFDARLCLTISTMACQDLVEGYVNSRLPGIVDFNIVREKREKIADTYRRN